MEQMDELRRPEANTRLLYKIVCGASGATILATIVYALANSALNAGGSLPAVGRSLVDASFPLPGFAQPVAYLSVAAVTFFYTALRLSQNKVAQWSRAKLASLQLLAIVVAFASAYQVMYSFMQWGSYFSVQLLASSLDSSAVSSPSPTPWTLVFATWMFAAFFVIGGYSVYFLRKIHQVRGMSDVF